MAPTVDATPDERNASGRRFRFSGSQVSHAKSLGPDWAPFANFLLILVYSKIIPQYLTHKDGFSSVIGKMKISSARIVRFCCDCVVMLRARKAVIFSYDKRQLTPHYWP